MKRPPAQEELDAINEHINAHADDPVRAYCLGIVSAIAWDAGVRLTRPFLDSLPSGPLDIRTAVEYGKKHVREMRKRTERKPRGTRLLSHKG